MAAGTYCRMAGLSWAPVGFAFFPLLWIVFWKSFSLLSRRPWHLHVWSRSGLERMVLVETQKYNLILGLTFYFGKFHTYARIEFSVTF